MGAKLILISIINQIILLDFIKWTAVPSYVIAFITSVVSIYFFALSIINKQNEKKMAEQTKIKVGVILFLISITATALSGALIVLFK